MLDGKRSNSDYVCPSNAVGHRAQLKILRLLKEASSRDANFIARHPSTLFQCLWNSCWWYDCPAAANHFEEDGARSKDEAKLYLLLESWRNKKECKTPNFVWLRSSRPPSEQLCTGQIGLMSVPEDNTEAVAISDDGRTIVSGSHDVIRIWDSETAQQILSLDERGRTLAIKSDGSRFVTGSWDRALRVWEANSGVELYCLRGHRDLINCLAISWNGRKIITGSEDHTVRLWDADTQEELRCITAHHDAVLSVAISPNGDRIASSFHEGTLRVWDWIVDKEIHSQNMRALALAFSSDGRKLVCASENNIRVLDVESGQIIQTLEGHSQSVSSVAISSETQAIVSGSYDYTVRAWNMETGEELNCFKGHKGWILAVAISSNGRKIVSSSGDGTIRIWDIAGKMNNRILKGHTNTIADITVTKDGKRAMTTGVDNTLRIWNVTTGEQLSVFKGHERPQIAIGADSQKILIFMDETLSVLSESNELSEMQSARGIRNVLLSANGCRIVGDFHDGAIRVWDTESRQELGMLKEHGTPVSGFALSADGKKVVAAWPSEVVVWHPETDEKTKIMTSGVTRVIISADGQRIVFGTEGGTIHICDLGASQLATVKGDFGLSELAISSDRMRLVSRSWKPTIQVWDVETRRSLEVIKGLCDLEAIANAEDYRFRAVSHGRETLIEGDSGPVAWFPDRLEAIKTVGDGTAWLGREPKLQLTDGNHLYIIHLEGVSN
jgi:WD40 repeat protein